MVHFSAKKSLGQNFLHAPHVVGKMVHAARIIPDGTVLEVGPGKGVLTEGLLATGAHIIAIEKDDRMIPMLQEKFVREITAGKLTLIHGDVLEFDAEKIGDYVVVANIPYYITGELLRKFLESAHPPLRMVLMVQKEVAQRIVSREPQREGKESILSISVKAFGEPKYIETVPARHFRPVPNVDSAVILIDSISNKLDGIDRKSFFLAVKTGFAHKRKVLIKNLEDIAPREKLTQVWEKIGLDPKVRAEDISLELWKKIVILIG